MYIKAKYGFKQLQNEQRKSEFKKIRAKSTYTTNRPVYWLAAASVIITSVLGWWYLSKPNIEQFADAYVKENFALISSTMASDKDKMQEAIGYFNDGKLGEANAIFDSLSKQNNADALKYAGITYLRQENYTKAIERFETLEKQSLKSNTGTFYHALALLKRKQSNDIDEAKKLLEKVKNEKLEGWQEIEKWNF